MFILVIATALLCAGVQACNRNVYDSVPWTPTADYVIPDYNWNPQNVEDFPFYMPSLCEVDKTFAGWQAKKATCLRQTTEESCLAIRFCWWRDTTNQNYLGAVMNVSSSPVIHEVKPGVYDVSAATGDLCRMTVIETATGVALVDCCVNPSVALATKESLKLHTNLGNKLDNVEAVVITHVHSDHFGGCAAWVDPANVYNEDGTVNVPVYASSEFYNELIANRRRAALTIDRYNRQGGNYLDVGTDGTMWKFYEWPSPTTILPITNFVPLGSSLQITLGSYNAELISMPSETVSHVAVWLPSISVVSCGDVYYRAVPNIGTPAAAPYRSVDDFLSSLKALRNLNAEVLINGHDNAVTGTANVYRELSQVIRRVEFALDFFLTRINEGMHPRDIAHEFQAIKLQDYPDLGSDEEPGYELVEVYSFPYALMRGLYSGIVGWFSGYVEELDEITTQDESERVVAAMGGPNLVYQITTHAVESAKTIDDLRWSMKLVAWLVRANDSQRNKELYAEICRRLAFVQSSLIKRNHYLSAAKLLLEE